MEEEKNHRVAGVRRQSGKEGYSQENDEACEKVPTVHPGRMRQQMPCWTIKNRELGWYNNRSIYIYIYRTRNEKLTIYKMSVLWLSMNLGNIRVGVSMDVALKFPWILKLS